jgi:hypothetical protein
MICPIRGDGAPLLVLSLDCSCSPVRCEFGLVQLAAWLSAGTCGLSKWPLCMAAWVLRVRTEKVFMGGILRN